MKLTHVEQRLEALNLQANEKNFFFFPLLLGLGFVLLYVFLPDWYLRIIQEDRPVEYLQTVSYFLSSAISFIAVVKLHKSKYKLIFWTLLIFAFSTMLIGLEEISWGQRILGFKTPKLLSDSNTQKELTIHNLYTAQRNTSLLSIIIGLYGGLAWFIRGDTKINLKDIRNFIVPDWYCCLYFLPIALFYYTHGYMESAKRVYSIHPQVASWRHQEPAELLLALGFLLVAMSNYEKISRLTNDQTSHSQIKIGVRQKKMVLNQQGQRVGT